MQPIGGNMNLDASPLFAPMPTPKKKKTGMFGGNIGEVLSAAINGYLAAGGNQAGMMGLQQLHARRAQQQQAELEAQLTKLRDQGLMLSGALAEVRRQLESLPSDEGTPAVEPVDFKSAQRRGS